MTRVFLQRAYRVALTIAGLALFILALQLLRSGASQLAPLLERFQVTGIRQSIGFGWLGAYIMLSGSPVAAISLILFSSGALSEAGTLGMLTGSRLGASFIVLLVGFLYHLRGQQRVASVAIGVLAFLVTATIYLPALLLGTIVLHQGWIDGLRLPQVPDTFNSILDVIFDPIVSLVVWLLPDWSVFLIGVGVLLAAFKLFDGVLPEVDAETSPFGNLAQAVYRPWIMFLVGAGFTTVTLSVSVSLTLLVPLTSRGSIRRENIIPYMLGANITTFIDTLVASFLVGESSAYTIVLNQILCVTIFSLIVLFLTYRPYQRVMNQLLDRILASHTSLAIFVLCTVGIPLALLFL